MINYIAPAGCVFVGVAASFFLKKNKVQVTYSNECETARISHAAQTSLKAQAGLAIAALVAKRAAAKLPVIASLTGTSLALSVTVSFVASTVFVYVIAPAEVATNDDGKTQAEVDQAQAEVEQAQAAKEQRETQAITKAVQAYTGVSEGTLQDRAQKAAALLKLFTADSEGTNPQIDLSGLVFQPSDEEGAFLPQGTSFDRKYLLPVVWAFDSYGKDGAEGLKYGITTVEIPVHLQEANSPEAAQTATTSNTVFLALQNEASLFTRVALQATQANEPSQVLTLALAAFSETLAPLIDEIRNEEGYKALEDEAKRIAQLAAQAKAAEEAAQRAKDDLAAAQAASPLKPVERPADPKRSDNESPFGFTQ